MTQTPRRGAPAEAPRVHDAESAEAAGWAAIAAQLDADMRCRDALAASGADLRPATVTLLAHLQAVRTRLQALRDTAHAAARLGAKATRDKGGVQ